MREAREVPVTQRPAWLLSFVLLLGVASAQADSLELHLSSMSKSVPIGKGIPLVLTYSNTGESPIVLQRPTAFGPETLNIVAIKEGCTYPISPATFTVVRSNVELYQVPLLPGDSFTTELPLIGSLDMFDELSLRVPGPGDYELKARLVIGNSSNRESLFWAGSATSNAVTITLSRPREAVIDAQLLQLQACLEDSSCHATQPEAFFSDVFEPRAVPLLSRALQQVPEDYFAGTALFRQGAGAPIKKALESEDLPDSIGEVYERYLRLLEGERDSCSAILEPRTDG